MIQRKSRHRRTTDTAAPENVKNGNDLVLGNRKGSRPAPKLQRTTFRTSREMDFFSEKELITQTGHNVDEWPLVVVKELLDNSLDACDEANIAPEVTVTADATGITVRDNGPGLPEDTLAGAMDFTIRVSNREAYVAPDRGAQGNALKTLIPMPVVLDPGYGRLIVTAGGKRHVITCGADPVTRRAVVNDDVTTCRQKGTEVRIEWGLRSDEWGIAWPFAEIYPCSDDPLDWQFAQSFKTLVEGFTLFNPHATIHLDWFGERQTWKATNPEWVKWRPSQPTSTYWYELRHLERLLGANIAHDRDHDSDRLVSDLIAEFDGMSGSQKRAAVLDETDLRRVRLSELVVNGRFDSKRIAGLLKSMQAHTRPIKSPKLGIIGEEHFRSRFVAIGIEPDSFRYSRKLAKCKKRGSGDDDKPCFLPWVLESAFGWLGPDAKGQRIMFSGANWSSSIRNPFRSFGATGEGLETVLADMRATRNEPVVFALHLAHPRLEYTDRGKSALVIGGAA